jgi:hypothetical protein
VVDSEASLALAGPLEAHAHSVGTGLFDFGYRDGPPATPYSSIP